MAPVSRNSIRLFNAFGITVFLHWSWFLVAAWQLDRRTGGATGADPLFWAAAEYLGLFALVLMHEFGHSLACRQVGGTAREIILWPLGGVAYVNPPPRPGAVLWSIAAGPLVNAVLVPVFMGVLALARWADWPATAPATFGLLRQLGTINLVLLIFNMLPVYPLDGGQILRSVLWFFLGRSRSLMVASLIGVAGAAAGAAWALWKGEIWLVLLAGFALTRSWSGLRHARSLARIEIAPRHDGYRCPACQAQPIRACVWMCGECREAFDPFESEATCPGCGNAHPTTICPECGEVRPFGQWRA